MTCSNYTKLGTGAGLAGGVISWAFYKGKENPIRKALNQTQKEDLIIYLAQNLCPTSIPKSTICLLSGPFVGAGTGASLYGIKNFRTVTQPTLAITWLITATAISAFSAHQIGKHD